MDQALADRDRANRLFDAYGGLLTGRQQGLWRRYFEDDLSLGEIATQARISRQAVHDGLQRALGALERYEAVLGLVSSPRAGRPAPGRRPAAERPYRTWGYPVVPVLFLLSAIFLLGNYMLTEPRLFAADVAVILTGLPVYAWWRRRATAG